MSIIMGVFTVFLLVYTVFNLIFGRSILNNVQDKYKDDSSYEDKIYGGCMAVIYLLVGIGMLIVYLIYLGFAFAYDPYVYPTGAMLALYFINVLRGNIKNNRQKKLKDQYKKSNNRTIFGVLYNLTMIAYFMYMIYGLFILE